MLTQMLPDVREIRATYDANGKVASITSPSRPARAHDYTPIDLKASYRPPVLAIGNVATIYIYNQDRQLTAVTRRDGQSLRLDDEPTGARRTTLAEAQGQTCPEPCRGTTFTHHPTTGLVATIASPGGVGLSYAYHGSPAPGRAAPA
ncbi:MAG TPA: hypothetical protein VLT62_10220 [Candidatus Methylomirabilis sp.]|nr:hypothetical protein [Candidatus Methylomirabilis sp.]